MNKNIFVGALALWTIAVPAVAAGYEEAREVYLSGDVSRAESLYRAIVADPAASPAERGNASRELARIAWLVDGDGPRAARILGESLPKDPDPCPGALLFGRILNEGRQPELVPTRLAPWQERCADLEPGVDLQITRAYTLAAAKKPAAARTAAVAAARASEQHMVPLTRAALESARQRMRIGLLAGDAEEALAGWRDYFGLGSASAPQAFGGSDAQVIATFRAGARRKSTEAEAMALATLLVRAGFADEVRQLASDRGLASARGALALRWDLIRRYLSLRDGLVAAALSHDRVFARTRRDDGDKYRSDVERVIQEAVEGLGRPGAAPMDVIREIWGLFGTPVGETGGVMSQHLGHIVNDEQKEVVQGERRGKIRFINLDNMIVNSFGGWLGDGERTPSGWATGGDTIIQVRPLYAGGVLSRLAIARPGPARDSYIQKVEQAEAEDRKLLSSGKIVYLLGMARRLRLQGIDALAAEVRSKPGPETFEQRFRRTWYDREIHCSITLHEGRHVLDQAQFKGVVKLDGAELEYRAKLSELSLCPAPRIQMGAIIGPGGDPHGLANRRILMAFDKWISAHRDQVAGFDPAIPAFAQLPKLTDDQIRAVGAELDREVRAKPAA